MKKRRSRHRFKKIPGLKPCSHPLAHPIAPSVDETLSTSATQAVTLTPADLTAELLELPRQNAIPKPRDSTESEVDLLGSNDSFLFIDEHSLSSGQGSIEDMDQDSTEQNHPISLHVGACAHDLAGLKLRNWQALWGIIMTNGNRKMTKSDYQSMRTVADAFGRMGLESWTRSDQVSRREEYAKQRITSLPHYRTLQRKIKPMLLKYLAPRGNDCMLNVDLRKAGARCSTNSPEGAPQIPVRVVLPSEHARADMATGPVFHQICSTSLENASPPIQENSNAVPSISVSECVDIWPIVAARSWFYGPPRRISVEQDGSLPNNSSFAEKQDVVRICLIGSATLTATLRCNFEVRGSEHEYLQLQGTISHIWTVHHDNRKTTSPGFEQQDVSHLIAREKEIVRAFSFVSYNSPSDSVNIQIPDIPLQNGGEDDSVLQDNGSVKKNASTSEHLEILRRRRASLKEKKRQVEIAWRDWQKPIAKPGDIITLLRPSVSSDFEGNSFAVTSPFNSHSISESMPYLSLVHRFCTENDEQDKHLFFVPSDLEFPPSSTDGIDHNLRNYCRSLSGLDHDMYRDVHSVFLVAQHCGKRGLKKFTPISSMGTLANGEKYLIYRFLLFWDAFKVLDGNSASSEGFYMICLNIPVKSRSSASAVRVLSLTPPGVKGTAIFKEIERDIIKSMTEGYLDYDANGSKRRIFLDLVGFIGDTSALNSSLDVMGHTASAFCLLCKQRRYSATVVGSKYTQARYSGLTTCAARSFYAHEALRDCNANIETCRLLGIRLVADSDLPIHGLRAAMQEVKHKIPNTSNGIPIISGEIDPYKSCLIAPDHLLTGHARDCINLAFALLPSRQHRVVCEEFMMGYLRECGLPLQNRLFDHDKKRLHTMSMSEMYALVIVAELGIRSGFAKAERLGSPSTVNNRRLDLAIELVASCANLIAKLWHKPDQKKDGTLAVASFENQIGGIHISGLQLLALQHISKVQDVCSMADADVIAMDDKEIDKECRAKISKDYSLALAAIKRIDQPNVHRILELFETTLPMVGHISRIGEIVLEKAHQPLKRAIKRSKDKESHILAIESICVNDWQGRLTMLLSSALSGEKEALLGCFRLLAGRESIASVGGKLKVEHISQVFNTLGPEMCVPAELLSQGQTVLSLTREPFHDISWILKGCIQTVQLVRGNATGYRREALSLLTAGYNYGSEQPTVEFGDILCSKFRNGLCGTSFCTGDVIETLCCKPSDTQFHFPFVVQPNSVRASADLALQSGSAFWYICAIFRVLGGFERCKVQAAAFPCQEVRGEQWKGEHKTQIRKFRIRSLLSILTIEPFTRKVATIHDCIRSDCSPSPAPNGIQHDHSSLLDGGAFFILSSKEGFPPRQG